MLKQRIATACILIVVLLVAIVLFPPTAFLGFIAIVVCLAAWEWSRLAGLRHSFARAAYVLLYPILLYLLLHATPALQQTLLSLSLLWWLVAFVLIALYPRLSEQWNKRPLLLLMGFAVLLPGWLGIIYLRSLDAHVLFIVLFLTLVGCADTGAYFAGRRFGRRKLAPAVSPNKTWEGVIGGLVACSVVVGLFLLAVSLAGHELSSTQLFIAAPGAILLAASSVVGDLFESMIKRQGNVKDSGTLLPGHGGLLDRIDSITAALPVYTFFLLLASLS